MFMACNLLYYIFFFYACFIYSGVLLWLVCAVYCVGPGAVQPSLLSDKTRPPGHASSSPAVPAGVEGMHAGCQGDLPHILCQGF